MDREAESRRAVMEGRSVLERTAQSLARSQRTAIETEELGANVVSELGEQRETLLRSKQRLTDTDQGLSQSRVLLRNMACNVVTNKILLILIILLEAGILATIVYLRFFKH